MFGGKQLYAFNCAVASGSEPALTSAADIYVWSVPFRCKPIRAGVTISTLTSSSVSIVVKFDRKQSTATRGNGDIGVITIPTAIAVGASYYENTDYVAAGTGTWAEYLHEGDQIIVEVTTASDSAGKGLPWVLVEVDPEQPGNNSAMVAG